jgi:hypothetical protein
MIRVEGYQLQAKEEAATCGPSVILLAAGARCLGCASSEENATTPRDEKLVRLAPIRTRSEFGPTPWRGVSSLGLVAVCPIQ